MSSEATTQSQILQRLEQMEDKEGIGRDELVWSETQEFGKLNITIKKITKDQLKREAIAAQKADDDAERQVKTLERRIKSLEADEQKKRLVILQTEELQLEAVLRVLEKDIQGDVFTAAYDAAQRMKYFNKTHAVILKNEQRGRTELINSERYEFLVMRQNADSAAAEQLRTEVLEKLQKQKKTIHDAYREQVIQRQNTLSGSRGKPGKNASPAADDGSSTPAQQDEQNKDQDEGEPIRSEVSMEPGAADEEEGNTSGNTAEKEQEQQRETVQDSFAVESDAEPESERDSASDVAEKPAEERDPDSGSRGDGGYSSDSHHDDVYDDNSSTTSSSPNRQKDEPPKNDEKPKSDTKTSTSANNNNTSTTASKSTTRKGKYATVNSKVDNVVPAEHFDKALDRVVEREGAAREKLETDEVNQLQVVERWLSYVSSQSDYNVSYSDMLAARFQEQFYFRQQEMLDRDEFNARQRIAQEERSGRTGLTRRQNRAVVQDLRRVSKDETRQTTHERKIADRRDRINRQHATFARTQADRQQQLLSDEPANDTERMQPAFLPRPPTSMTASGRSSSPAMGTTQSRSRDVHFRVITSLQDSQRKEIETEARLEYYTILSEFDSAAGLKDSRRSFEVRNDTARERRAEQHTDRVKKVKKKLTYEDQRFVAAQKKKKETKLHVDKDALQRQEAARRCEINIERGDFAKEALRFSKVLVRLNQAVHSLQDAESAKRKEIVDAEARLLGSIRSSMLVHRPQPPREPTKPLPMPPIKFDEHVRMLKTMTVHHPEKDTKKVKSVKTWNRGRPTITPKTNVVRLSTIRAPNNHAKTAAAAFEAIPKNTLEVHEKHDIVRKPRPPQRPPPDSSEKQASTTAKSKKPLPPSSSTKGGKSPRDEKKKKPAAESQKKKKEEAKKEEEEQAKVTPKESDDFNDSSMESMSDDDAAAEKSADQQPQEETTATEPKDEQATKEESTPVQADESDVRSASPKSPRSASRSPSPENRSPTSNSPRSATSPRSTSPHSTSPQSDSYSRMPSASTYDSRSDSRSSYQDSEDGNASPTNPQQPKVKHEGRDETSPFRTPGNSRPATQGQDDGGDLQPPPATETEAEKDKDAEAERPASHSPRSSRTPSRSPTRSRSRSPSPSPSPSASSRGQSSVTSGQQQPQDGSSHSGSVKQEYTEDFEDA